MRKTLAHHKFLFRARKGIQLARGDVVMPKFLLDRLLPKEPLLQFHLPKMRCERPAMLRGCEPHI